MPLNRVRGHAFDALVVHSDARPERLCFRREKSRPGVRERRARLGVLILLVLLLVHAQCVQAAAEVLPAVIQSWHDPDTDDGNNITPLIAGDIDEPGGRPNFASLGLSGNLKPSHMLGSDQIPVSRTESREPHPPPCLERIASPYSPSSCRAPLRS